MNAADVLERAADLIDRGGWFGAKMGDVFTFDGCQAGGGNCAITAIVAVQDGQARYVKASGALMDFIGDTNIPRWNNTPERTKAEVTSTMRAVAALLRARESTQQPVEEAVEA